MGSDLLLYLIHPDDLPQAASYRSRFGKTEDDFGDIERRIAHRDGTWRWFHSHEIIFRRDSTGQPEQIFGVAQDITHLKVLEAERETAITALKEVERRLVEADNFV